MIRVNSSYNTALIKAWTFPGGERNVKFMPDVSRFADTGATITCYFKSSDDVMDLLHTVNALRNAGVKQLNLKPGFFRCVPK